MELPYPSQRPQNPSLSPYFLLFKHHSTQKAFYRLIEGNLTDISSGNVLELVATRIFYSFLNIYKLSSISREQNVVEIRRPKITPST